jgi:hypothetical protein
VLPKDACEWAQVAADVWIWHRYEPAVKADLFSTALRLGGGIVLVDPISPLPAELEGAFMPVAAVLVTNGNHARDAQAFGTPLAAPIYAHSAAHDELGIAHVRDISTAAGSKGVTIIPVDGAAAGEVALHTAAGGGTLVVGDALINMGSYGFTFLPAKYCTNPKLMRKSLRALLDLQFERILFAHGEPIMTDARKRLVSLLESGS